MIKINGIDHYFGGKGGSGTYQRIIKLPAPERNAIINAIEKSGTNGFDGTAAKVNL